MDTSHSIASSNEGDLPERQYMCFLSYRHADNKRVGRQWATWLHHAIETYEVPADLVGKKTESGERIPQRIYPVFRDEDELPADAALSTPLIKALKNCRHLLVLCSPGAAGSRFVAHEIRYFKAIRKRPHVLAAIISGEPNVTTDIAKQRSGFHLEDECFPKPLRYEVEVDGKVSARPAEPIAADFRLDNGKEGWTNSQAYREDLDARGVNAKHVNRLVAAYDDKLTLMKLKIIAGILGIPLGLLTKRDQAHQLKLAQRRARVLRRWVAVVGLLAITAIIAGALAWNAMRNAEALAQQRQDNSDLLIKHLAPLAYHILNQGTDLEAKGQIMVLLSETKGAMMPKFDVASFKQSWEAMLFCQLVASCILSANDELVRSSLTGMPLEHDQLEIIGSAQMYAAQMGDMVSRLRQLPDLNAQLEKLGAGGLPFDILESEVLMANGGVLLYKQDYEAAIPLLERSLAMLEEWNAPGVEGAFKHGDIFECAWILSLAYMHSGRVDEARAAASKSLDSGELLVQNNHPKSQYVNVRYLLIGFLDLLDDSHLTRLQEIVSASDLTDADIEAFRVRMFGE